MSQWVIDTKFRLFSSAILEASRESKNGIVGALLPRRANVYHPLAGSNSVRNRASTIESGLG